MSQESAAFHSVHQAQPVGGGGNKTSQDSVASSVLVRAASGSGDRAAVSQHSFHSVQDLGIQERQNESHARIVEVEPRFSSAYSHASAVSVANLDQIPPAYVVDTAAGGGPAVATSLNNTANTAPPVSFSNSSSSRHPRPVNSPDLNSVSVSSQQEVTSRPAAETDAITTQPEQLIANRPRSFLVQSLPIGSGASSASTATRSTSKILLPPQREIAGISSPTVGARQTQLATSMSSRVTGVGLLEQRRVTGRVPEPAVGAQGERRMTTRIPGFRISVSPNLSPSTSPRRTTTHQTSPPLLPRRSIFGASSPLQQGRPTLATFGSKEAPTSPRGAEQTLAAPQPRQVRDSTLGGGPSPSKVYSEATSMLDSFTTVSIKTGFAPLGRWEPPAELLEQQAHVRKSVEQAASSATQELKQRMSVVRSRSPSGAGLVRESVAPTVIANRQPFSGAPSPPAVVRIIRGTQSAATQLATVPEEQG
ncbi:unnamed protein product [Amoebophrya sp. A25]|nr:unnamed protein product [Amoebophrya sp. A25]|eukprot:GSA25T00001565001.1